jgi:hypothetical protein
MISGRDKTNSRKYSLSAALSTTNPSGIITACTTVVTTVSTMYERISSIQTAKRRKANWIGHILRGNCLLKHMIEGKMEGKIEVTGRRGRRPTFCLIFFLQLRGLATGLSRNLLHDLRTAQHFKTFL